MFVLRFFLQPPSLWMLGVVLLVTGLPSLLHALSASRPNRVDCDLPGARFHPHCREDIVLLVNGQIHTLGEPGEVEALAVQSGIIVGAGTTEALLARHPDARKVDLNRHHVYPGCIDLRVDLLAGGIGRAHLNLEAVEDSRRFESMLRSFAQAHPELPWIFGQGWSVAALAGQTPSVKSLDPIVGDRPLWLWRRDHQAAVLSSAALERVGIRSDTPDPSGGTIERDRSGAPTGVLTGAAADQAFSRAVAQLPSHKVKAALLAAQQHLLALGITRVGHVGSNEGEVLAALGELYEDAQWRLRVQLHPTPGAPRGWQLRAYRSPAPDVLQLGVPALVLDGPPGGSAAALSQTAPDDEKPILPRASASEIRAALASEPLPGAHLVAYGDAARDAGLEALSGPSDRTAPRFVSSLFWSDQALEQAARVGVVPLLSPAGLEQRWPVLRGRIPDALQPQVMRYRSIVRALEPAALGSGWPTAPASPLLHVRAVISALETTRETLPVWHDDETLTLEQAQPMLSLNPARSLGLEGREGALVSGARADAVVLSRALSELTGEDWEQVELLMTLIGGEVVWRKEGGLQVRVDLQGLEDAPPLLKVLARQHLWIPLMGVGLLLWPALCIALYFWQTRLQDRRGP